MSLVGTRPPTVDEWEQYELHHRSPRPQLVRDMVFMTPEQRMRHTAKPGLSGLAQVNGRNAISWEDKISSICRIYAENFDWSKIRLHTSCIWRIIYTTQLFIKN